MAHITGPDAQAARMGKGGEEVTFAEQIIALREAHGLSRREFGRKIGVVKSTLYSWENGLSLPSKQSLQRISDAFQLPMDASQWPEMYVRKPKRSGKKKCMKCKYAFLQGRAFVCCEFILIEHQRRGCPAGDGCTRYKPATGLKRMEYMDYSSGGEEYDE